MTVDTITVFRAGTLATEPAPEWMLRARQLAHTAGWYGAIERVLEDEGSVTEVHGRGEVAGLVSDWPTPGGGRYVEVCDRGEAIISVWIPDAADWLAFYTGHITPFLRLQVEMATLGELERIGNALIAYARHGEGEHIERRCGRSRIDMEYDRHIHRRAAQAVARERAAARSDG